MDAQPGRYRLQLVGPFGLFDPQGRRIEISSKKGVAMLALLATAPEGRHARAWMQGMLWSSRGQAQAQGSFRRELSNLARTLESGGGGALLLRDGVRLALALDHLEIDVLSLAVGLRPRQASVQGEFLEGIDLPDCDEFEGWLRDRRRWCREVQNYEVPATATALPEPAGVNQPQVFSLKPSVAVMPFRVRGSIAPYDPLGLGLAEAIELALGNLRTLSVATTRSTLALTERGLTLIEIASQLGVRYLIDGVIRRGGSNGQLTLLLVDGSNGHQVWSYTHDSPVELAAASHEQVAQIVAPRLHTKIDIAELESGMRAAEDTDDPVELYWKANALFRSRERDGVVRAAALCDRLLAVQTVCASGEALAGFCHATIHAQHWSEDRNASLRAARRHYQNAIRLGGTDAMVMGYAAGTLALLGEDIGTAERLITRALEQLPRHQPTLFWGGWIDLAVNNPVRAYDRFSRSLQVNPEAAVRGHTICGMGLASLLKGDLASGRELLLEARLLMPLDALTLAALVMVYSLSGEAGPVREAAMLLDQAGGVELALAYFRDSNQQAMLERLVAEARLAPA
jgi:TolB-like protein